MSVEVVTKEDLESFRIRLLNDLSLLLKPALPPPQKQWLKGIEVRRMLGISAGTMQNLRITGKLSSSRIGGIHFYRFSDVEKLLQENYSKK